jgi:hypothetical protein
MLVMAALVAGCFGHQVGYAVGAVNDTGADVVLHLWGRDGFVLTGPTSYLVPAIASSARRRTSR